MPIRVDSLTALQETSMKKATITIIVIVILVALSTITGCGRSQEPDVIPEPIMDTDSVVTLPDVTTITIGGMYFSGEILQALIDFNSENDIVQIALRDYTDETDGNWIAAQTRLQTELIAGRGPDIIFDPDKA